MRRRPRRIRTALAPLLAAALLLASAAGAPAAPSTALTAQPGAIDFGLVNVDWGEQGGSVSIRNDGSVDVAVGAASVDGSAAFRVTNDGCSGAALVPGATCWVNVGFDPSDGSAYAATLRVPSDGGDAAVALSGTGGVQRAGTTPAALDFGTVAVGASVTRTLRFANTGNLPYQAIVAIPTGLDVGAFRVVRDTCSLVPLDPGDGCDLSVRFAPEAAGDVEATLMVIGGDTPPVLVPLRGSGAPAAGGAAVVAPGAVDFGVRRLGARRRAVRLVTVVNAGAGPLRVADVALGGRDAGWFRIAGESCVDTVLAPTASCAVRVRFAPRATGAMTARLRIVSDAPTAVAALGGRVVRARR